jgi:hypothetical protein
MPEIALAARDGHRVPPADADERRPGRRCRSAG